MASTVCIFLTIPKKFSRFQAVKKSASKRLYNKSANPPICP